MSSEESAAVAGDAPDLAEGYPTLKEVVRGILEDDAVPDIGVRRVEINCFASGDATYRVWILGREETEGGYLGELGIQ